MGIFTITEQKLLLDIKNLISELEEFTAEDMKKSQITKESLLEVCTKLTDCIVDIKNNFQIVEAHYKYNEEDKKPEYIISMTERMEKQLLERIKDIPDYKSYVDDIKNDKDYPDTFRNHVASVLTHVIFNFIEGYDDSVEKAEKNMIDSMNKADDILKNMSFERPKCPEYNVISNSDFATLDIMNKDVDKKIYFNDNMLGRNDFASFQT